MIKDGFKKDNALTELIDRVSRDIVSKSKFSQHLSEKLRSLNVYLNKRNVTRWNSTLFMVKSVLSLTDNQYSKVRNHMYSIHHVNGKSNETTKQMEIRKKFILNKDEKDTSRATLEELVFVLEGFLKVTNMFQGDGVTISRVYPSVLYLKKLLSMTTYTNSSKIITPISFVTEFMSKC